MPAQPTKNQTLTLTFTGHELAQLEAFATLHGLSVATFIQRAALDAAHIRESKKAASSLDTSWLSESLAQTSPPQPKASDLFAPASEGEKSEVIAPVPPATPTPPRATKRGVTGERSTLAKGSGPVWDIRCALGTERVHGLGWTRDQLAFVLKLSVVGVRKMEHCGTAPVKSLTARHSLLTLAKTLETPTPEILSFIAAEEAALG